MLARRHQRQRLIIAAITLVATLFGSLAVATDFLQPSLQNAVYDFMITNVPAKVKNQITIVGIDDATVERYGPWPIPRQAYVDLLTTIKGRPDSPGPRVVAFDVGFYDPSPNPEQDRALAAAIKDAGNVILAAQGQSGETLQNGVTNYTTMLLPLPMYREAAAGLGTVNVRPDEDARLREVNLVLDHGSIQRYYALPIVAVARQLLAGRQTLSDERGIRVEPERLVLPGRAPIPDRVMPVDSRGSVSVYYASRPATDLRERPPADPAKRIAPCATTAEFCVVSLADVVAGHVPRSLLANRVVFVGAHSLSGVPDDYPTPNSGGGKMWGVEVWANTAQSVFTNRFPVPRQSLPATAILIAAATLSGVLLVARWRLYGLLASLGLLVVYVVAAFVLFSTQTASDLGTGPIEVPSIGYVVPSIFWWVMALGYVLIEEQLSLARTKSTFGRFVTPSVARTIMEREETGRLALGGEGKEVTVLFGDIRGFTTLSEGMQPAQLLDTLNQYFDGMVDVVNRYEGTVNKYNGDNIMVIWNAPLPVEGHARKAVECALELQRFIVSERAKGGPDVAFGFGINTGNVVAGFLGAKGRMEYTVIGDTANVASRLTSADIARRDQVACSGQTLALLGEDIASISLGAIPVKGRAEPVECYQIDRIGTVASPNPAPPPERPVARAAVAGYH